QTQAIFIKIVLQRPIIKRLSEGFGYSIQLPHILHIVMGSDRYCRRIVGNINLNRTLNSIYSSLSGAIAAAAIELKFFN
ncbi:MAG TPA: hypothetical protein V6C95_02350, partial [Coleofasciculaceae cyanobacterium]